jgi:hypothetical protein
MAVGVGSIGMVGYYKEVMCRLGLSMDDALHVQMSRRDSETNMKRIRQSSDPFKHKRASSKIESIRKDNMKTYKDLKRGWEYRNGLAVQERPGDVMKAPKRGKKVCHYCGLEGNQTHRYKACLHHQQWIDRKTTNSSKNKDVPSIAWDPSLDEIPFESNEEIPFESNEEEE